MPESKAMNDRILSINQLAKFARVTRDTLIHYDKIGLVKPVKRGENNYRYYSDEQIALVNLIRTLQLLGMPLKDIGEFVPERTPESILTVFSQQLIMIDHDIEELTQVRKLLLTYQAMIEEASAVDEHQIAIHWQEAEKIFLGPVNDYSGRRSLNDALLDFYKYCDQPCNQTDLNYAAWGVYSQERLERGDWNWPDRFYFNNPDGADVKPAGLYVTGYTRGNYGQSDALYRRLIAYVATHDLEICGPAYETYPLNEISIPDPNQYLMRVSITVKQK
jgi:DNA-binding transcriptional MerR regulator